MKLILTKCFLFLVIFELAARGKAPAVQDAQSFMEKAEIDLLNLYNEGQCAEWIEETYITSDTETESARAQDRIIARTTGPGESVQTVRGALIFRWTFDANAA